MNIETLIKKADIEDDGYLATVDAIEKSKPDSLASFITKWRFLIAHDRRLEGILSLHDLKAVPREHWRQKRARDVMRPVMPQMFVPPSTPLEAARDLMQSNGVGSVAVVDAAGRLVGFLQNGRLKPRKRS